MERFGKINMLVVMGMFLASSLLAGYPVSGDAEDEGTVTLLDCTLPTGRQRTSAVWDGRYVYIFGGHDGSSFLDDIVRFDPINCTVTTLSSSLPSGRVSTSAVWDGQFAYIFGGYPGGTRWLDEIIRFDPATGVVTNLPSKLPTGRGSTSAIWDGRYAYIFGGRSGPMLDEIVKFDPTTGIVSTLPSTLPSPRWETSAAWDGQYAYIFGGVAGSEYDDIVQFNPRSGSVTLLTSTLPRGSFHTSAVWGGKHAYIFSGQCCFIEDDIVQFDPATGEVIRLSLSLPSLRTYTSATWDGQHAYIIGGAYLERGEWRYFDEIVRFTPPEQQPSIVEANINVDPDTFNLKSKGKSITAYIELEGADVRDINASSILLNDALSPILDTKYGFVTSEDSYIVDNDQDGIMERMVKFDRREVEELLAPSEEVVLTISGSLYDGSIFEGSDTIRVIDPR